MAAPQGLITFDGVNTVLHGSASVAHGTTPGTATLYIAPQPGFVPTAGTLRITYPGTFIQWRDCRVLSLTSEIDESGKEVWVMQIVDRRWKWQGLGAVNGCFNQKSADTDLLFVPGTERNPRQLAQHCLQALGEQGGNLNALPTNARPEVEWDYEDPATVLSALVEQFGCHVTLDLAGRANIVRMGVGRGLPGGGSLLTDSTTLDPPERPDEIRIATARIRCQVDLAIEPVGYEKDGTLKPINQLSYKPKAGWETVDPVYFNNIEDVTLREFVRDFMFRLYRIKTPFQIPAIDARGRQSIDNLSRILPIESQQLDTAQARGETPRPLSAWVYGIYANPNDPNENVITRGKLDPNRVADKDIATGFYAESFQVDTNRGLVTFDRPVFMSRQIKTEGGPLGWLNPPAELYLRTTISVRDKDTHQWLRYERKQPIRGRRGGTPPRIEKKDEMGLNVITRYSRSFIRIARQEDNHREVDRFADYYLRALADEYRPKEPQARSYAGFLPIELDGRVLQVSWVLGEDGSAKTLASSDVESLQVAMPYQEARDLRTIKQLRDRQLKPPASRQFEQAQAQRVRT